MLYVLAAWTGLRRNELGSLTPRSLALDGSPPTVTVAAAYSKRKRQDVQVLHGDVVSRLRAWLKTKRWLTPDDLLFPVAKNGKGGADRKTSKMMRVDLAAARTAWLDEAPNDVERARREATDFLLYVDACGRYADFHATRHTFITNLEKAGVSPRLAQTLARHSDIRLTMSVYTHVGLADVTGAVEALGGIGGHGECVDRGPKRGA
ncbi:MAG: tyrosine-type recombinase/integrase [Planctomycetota bacterium]